MLEGIDKRTKTRPQKIMERTPNVFDSDSLSKDEGMESHAGEDGDQGKDTTQETLRVVSLLHVLVFIEIPQVLTYVKRFGIRNQRESHIKLLV